MIAQDPNELFDVLRADGSATGQVKARHAVHRDGDWHRSLHVWVAGFDATGEPFLLLQRRGKDKDVAPGILDATVGGHFRTGETLVQVVREVEEEIGISVTVADLRRLGTRASVVDALSLGIADRELQEVYLLRDDRPLTDYRLNAAEVDELVRVSLPALLAFLAGDVPELTARVLDAHTGEVREVTLDRSAFIASVDNYYYRVAVAVGFALRGERHVVI